MPRVLIALILCSACTGNSPSSPSVVTPPAPTLTTLTGHLTALNGGQALGGVSVTSSAFTSMTDGAGGFTASLPMANSVMLALTGSGIVPRSVYVAVTGARDVNLTAIGLSGGFDLAFYRQLVRNGADAPGTLQPIRRWTVPPKIYVRTVDETGGPIDAATLSYVTFALSDGVNAWTGQRPEGIEQGAETRLGVPGWITVRWPAPVADHRCGEAEVGVSGGRLDLFYKEGGICRCPGQSEIRRRTVRHEVGHAMGFWHTADPGLMSNLPFSGCDQPMTVREQLHAAIAYQRPVGNVDPDTDSAATVNLRAIVVQ